MSTNPKSTSENIEITMWAS